MSVAIYQEGLGERDNFGGTAFLTLVSAYASNWWVKDIEVAICLYIRKWQGFELFGEDR